MLKKILKGAAAAALVFDTCAAVSQCVDAIRIRRSHPKGANPNYRPKRFARDCNLSYLVDKDDIRSFKDDFVHDYVLTNITVAAGDLYDALPLQDQGAAEKLLLALIDFLRAEAPAEEQSYPSLLEILTSMKNLPYGEKDAVDCLLEEYKKHQTKEPEYFHEYCEFKQMVDDKDAVIHTCIVAVTAIVQELYGEVILISPEAEIGSKQ